MKFELHMFCNLAKIRAINVSPSYIINLLRISKSQKRNFQTGLRINMFIFKCSKLERGLPDCSDTHVVFNISKALSYESNHIISYHTISYHIISYHIISYHIISYHIISYHIISYHIISYHIISYHIISYHIISYHIISYHIISYHIISYHIIS